MLKILFVIHDLGGGGAEKVLVNLVNKLDKKKFDITVLSIFGGGVNEKYISDDVKHYSYFKHSFPGNSKLLTLFSPKLLHKIMIREKFDVEVSFLEGVSARVVSGNPNEETKLLSWIHVEQKNRKIAKKAFRNYKEAVSVYKKFDKTFAVSQSVLIDFMNIFPEITNLSVLYNVQDTSKIQCAKEIFARRNESSLVNTIRLLGVGKLQPSKGFNNLILITKHLIDMGYSVHTKILGCGPEREKYEKLIDTYKLQNNVQLLGYKESPYNYYLDSDLFVCTSTSEGFSTAASEALLLGIPVVSTPVAGMEELLEEWSATAISKDFSEYAVFKCIENLLSNRDLYDKYLNDIPRLANKLLDENTLGRIEQTLSEI